MTGMKPMDAPPGHLPHDGLRGAAGVLNALGIRRQKMGDGVRPGEEYEGARLDAGFAVYEQVVRREVGFDELFVRVEGLPVEVQPFQGKDPAIEAVDFLAGEVEEAVEAIGGDEAPIVGAGFVSRPQQVQVFVDGLDPVPESVPTFALGDVADAVFDPEGRQVFQVTGAGRPLPFVVESGRGVVEIQHQDPLAGGGQGPGQVAQGQAAADAAFDGVENQGLH